MLSDGILFNYLGLTLFPAQHLYKYKLLLKYSASKMFSWETNLAIPYASPLEFHIWTCHTALTYAKQHIFKSNT